MLSRSRILQCATLHHLASDLADPWSGEFSIGASSVQQIGRMGLAYPMDICERSLADLNAGVLAKNLGADEKVSTPGSVRVNLLPEDPDGDGALMPTG